MSQDTRETAAIVLDSRDHGESDKIITLYTQDHGRITGIAKGANKSKKRFLNKLELFSSISLCYSANKRSSLVLISDADLHSSFIELRLQVELYNTATFIRETLLIATVEGEGDSELFRLLHWSLQALESGKSYLGVATIFLLRLFERLGYRPNFSQCSRCQKPFNLNQHYSFSQLSGGLICQNCEDQIVGEPRKLSSGTIRMINSASGDPLERLHRLQFSRQALNEALPMLHRYARNLFQRDIHSWKIIKKMLLEDRSARQGNT